MSSFLYKSIKNPIDGSVDLNELIGLNFNIEKFVDEYTNVSTNFRVYYYYWFVWLLWCNRYSRLFPYILKLEDAIVSLWLFNLIKVEA